MEKLNLINHLKLYFVTNTNQPFDQYLKIIEEAVKGGVTIVQLREKNLAYEEIKLRALKLKTLLDKYNVPLIINDYVEIAKEINAAGVHLGFNDKNLYETRKILGDDKIIGLSVENLKQLTDKTLYYADYISISVIFPSKKTKTNCHKIWGLEGVEKIIKMVPCLPIIGIGGINLTNLRSIMEKGIDGVAVVGAINDKKDPYKAAKDFIKVINKYK